MNATFERLLLIIVVEFMYEVTWMIQACDFICVGLCRA